MSQLLKSTDTAPTDKKLPGFSGSSEIEAALNRASEALSAQEASEAREVQRAAMQAQDEADARHRRARKQPVSKPASYCGC